MIYVANDVEASGNRLGFHPTLSIGACVVTREFLNFNELTKRGLVFYAEIKPYSLKFELEAARVGCSCLSCLDDIRKFDSRYDPTSAGFEPALVLEKMQNDCEEPALALERFKQWAECISEGQEVEGVTDTVFFDSGHINLCFGRNIDGVSPFGWTGLDLDSLYRGYTGREDAKLSELNLPDTRTKPHRADHDAVFLAQIARVLLYEKLGW